MSTPPAPPSFIGRFLPVGLTFILLAGFPLLLAGIALEYLLDVRRQNAELARFAGLDEKLVQLQPFADPEQFLKGSLRRIALHCNRSRRPLAELVRVLGKLEARYPDLFTFTVFDGGGKLVRRQGSGESQFIPERVLAMLTDLHFGRRAVERVMFLRNYRSMLENFIGNFMESALFRGAGWIPTLSKPRKSWFFYHIDHRFSFFANIHRGGYRSMMGLEAFLRKKSFPGLSLHLINLETGEIIPTPRSPDAGTLRTVVGKFETESLGRFKLRNRLWSIMMLDPNFRLAASVPDDLAEGKSQALGAFRLFCSIFLLLGFHTCWLVMRRETLPHVSIRWKLMILFLLSGGLPLLILGFTISGYLDARQGNLMQLAEQRSGDLLRDFDARFPAIGPFCQRHLKPVLAGCHLNLPADFVTFTKRFDGYRRRFDVYNNILVSSMGAEIRIPSPAQVDSGLRKIVVGLTMRAFSVVNGDAQPSTPTVGEALVAGLLADKTLENSVNEFLSGFGRMVNFQAGDFDQLILLELIRGASGLADFAFALTWERRNIMGLYVRYFIPRKPLEDGTEVVALDPDPVWKTILHGNPRSRKGMFTFRGLYKLFPRKPFTFETFRFFRMTMRKGILSAETVRFRGSRYLAVGIPGKLLKSSFLFALKPLEPLEKEIASLRSRFTIFGGLSIGFTSLLGLLLARKFLNPIGDLAAGIEAVRRKTFTHRIPQQDPDELGDLAKLFNTMLEGLQEMSIARDVQHELFPQAPLEVGEFRISGKSLPALELGGDYFDFKPLPDGRMLVIIGDVMGHGVSSALGMTMAKVMFHHMADSGWSPEKMVEELNRVMLETLKRRLPMTMNVFCLDPATGDGLFINCGHPFPLHFKTDGSSDFVEAFGPSLGHKQRFRFTPGHVNLAPGDRLIFYTDGMVESLAYLDRFEKARDYFIDFQEFLSAELAKSPSDPCLAFLQNHPFLRTGRPQPDDFTVVIIERRLPPAKVEA